MPAPSPILVTGSTGLLGGAVVRRLVADDRPVRVLSRRPGEGAPSGIETIIGDISDEAVLDAAVAGVSAVIHAAGPMQGPDDVLYRSVYLASRRFAEIARAAGVERFVYVSTVAVYGHGRLADIDETHPIAPVSSYARAKAAAEDAVREAFRGAEGQSAWIIRPTNIYGPNDRHFGPLITALVNTR